MKMSRLRKIVSGTVGSEIAEAALVLPIFFMIMLGIYWFGRAFNVYATINHAAREGARAAAAPTCATCAGPVNPTFCSTGISCQPTPDQVAGFVKQALQASSLDPGQVTNLGAARTACGGGTASCQKPSAAGQPSICVYYNVQLPSTLPSRFGDARLRSLRAIPISVSIFLTVHFRKYAEDYAECRRADDGRVLTSMFRGNKLGTCVRLRISLLRGTDAAAIIEFAVALPLLVVLVVGIFDFGGAFNLKQELNNAAREGARFGAAQPTNDISPGI